MTTESPTLIPFTDEADYAPTVTVPREQFEAMLAGKRAEIENLTGDYENKLANAGAALDRLKSEIAEQQEIVTGATLSYGQANARAVTAEKHLRTIRAAVEEWKAEAEIIEEGSGGYEGVDEVRAYEKVLALLEGK